MINLCDFMPALQSDGQTNCVKESKIFGKTIKLGLTKCQNESYKNKQFLGMHASLQPAYDFYMRYVKHKNAIREAWT